MWGALLINYSDRQVIFSIFPVLKSELGFTDTQLGLTGSVFLWVYAVCSPIAGQIADWYSKKFLVVLSLLSWSLVTLASGSSHSVLMLLGCRAMLGVTQSLFFPAAIALVANTHTPSTRSRAIALFASAQLAGIVLGGWWGGLVAQHSHWRIAFYSLGAVGFLYAVPCALFLRTTTERIPVETKKSEGGLAIAVLARVPSFRLLCIAASAFVFVLWFLYTWLPNFLYERFSLTLADAGFTATAYLQSGTAVGLLLGGVLADWLFRRTKAARFWLVSAGLLLTAPYLHLLGNSDSLLFAKVTALGLGLCGGVLMVNLAPSAFDVISSDTRSSAAGMLNLIGGSVAGFGALVGGMWKESVGISNLMSYSSLVCAASGLLIILSIRVYFKQDYAKVH